MVFTDLINKLIRVSLVFFVESLNFILKLFRHDPLDFLLWFYVRKPKVFKLIHGDFSFVVCLKR
ncbi:MAG: hypothetical protein CMN72_16045 [Sphingomonas sp.]|nr:hypothetical protein [Sphingomonas sp.]